MLKMAVIKCVKLLLSGRLLDVFLLLTAMHIGFSRND